MRADIISWSSTFFWDFKDFLINMITIIFMIIKMATRGLLKLKVFWIKGYDVTNKILSRDAKYIVDVAMCPRFGNSRISMRELS